MVGSGLGRDASESCVLVAPGDDPAPPAADIHGRLGLDKLLLLFALLKLGASVVLSNCVVEAALDFPIPIVVLVIGGAIVSLALFFLLLGRVEEPFG